MPKQKKPKTRARITWETSYSSSGNSVVNKFHKSKCCEAEAEIVPVFRCSKCHSKCD